MSQEIVGIIILFSCVMFILAVRKIKMQAIMENAFRSSYGLKEKTLSQHVFDMALGKSFTLLTHDYADRNAFMSISEAAKIVAKELKEKESAKSVQK